MKKIFALITTIICIFILVGCGGNQVTTTEALYDANPTEIDHYFGNQLSFKDTGTTIEGKNFVKDKVGFVDLKSVTDGDTAVFHLRNREVDLSPKGNNHSYLTVRFLGIDTPESTSSIQAWGKKASAYVTGLLENATGIILDATDIDTTGVDNNGIKAGYRLDSNGTRWLALVWYTNSTDTTDLDSYRLLQLDVIEECYSRFTGGDFSKRYVYNTSEELEPKLYSRYEEAFGSLKLGELLFEAATRMSLTKLRRFGTTQDDGFDYSTTPKQLDSVKDAYDNFEEYSSRGTYVAVTGVITRFIGPNFYIADSEGYGLYIYMGIDGNGIEGEGNSRFKVGDTINIRGRICQYGGQVQMSGIEFTRDTFIKITDESKKIALPEVYEITGRETAAELDALVGKLVSYDNMVIESIGNLSKDLSYSLTTAFEISELKNAGASYYNLQVRINGTASLGTVISGGEEKQITYDYCKANMGSIVKATGIMSIYQEMDVQIPVEKRFPSYQIVVGNKLPGQGSELGFN